VSVSLISFLLLSENKEKPKLNAEPVIDCPISSKLEPETILILNNQVVIQGGQNSYWTIKDNSACGIYIKKSFFPKIFIKNTELKVKWVTDKRVLLPGLTYSIENQDTVIFAENNSGTEIFIVLVNGDLEIIKKRNKTFYKGDAKLATMKDLLGFFRIN
jgi:hypothetical protein